MSALAALKAQLKRQSEAYLSMQRLVPGIGSQYETGLKEIEELERGFATKAAEADHVAKELTAQRSRFDQVLKAAYALNQEAHCYDLQPPLFELLSEQTTLLRKAIEDPARPVPEVTPAPAKTSSSTVVWRDVRTELPDDCETVLISCEDGEVDTAFYLSEHARWTWITEHEVTCRVTAWGKMPDGPTKSARDDLSRSESQPEEKGGAS